MTLLLMRHGEAGSHSRDELRELTPRGHDDTRRMGRLLRKLGLVPSRAWSSPFTRARQTINNVLGDAAPCAVELSDLLVPSANPADQAEWLFNSAATDGVVLAVGHQPAISGTVAALTAGRAISVSIEPGTLIEMELCSSAHIAVIRGVVRPAYLNPDR